MQLYHRITVSWNTRYCVLCAFLVKGNFSAPHFWGKIYFQNEGNLLVPKTTPNLGVEILDRVIFNLPNMVLFLSMSR